MSNIFRTSKFDYSQYYLKLNFNQIFNLIEFFIQMNKIGEWKNYQKIQIIPFPEKDYVTLRKLITDKYESKFKEIEYTSTKFIDTYINRTSENKFFFLDLSKKKIEINLKFFLELQSFDQQFFLKKEDRIFDKLKDYAKKIESYKSSKTNIIFFDPYIAKDPKKHFKILKEILNLIISGALSEKGNILIYNDNNVTHRIYEEKQKIIKEKEELLKNEPERDITDLNKRIENKDKDINDKRRKKRNDVKMAFPDFEVLTSWNFHDRYIVSNHLVVHFYGGSGDISDVKLDLYENHKSTGIRIYFPFLKSQLEYLDEQLIYLKDNHYKYK